MDTLHLLADAAALLVGAEQAGSMVSKVFARLSAHLHCDVFTNFAVAENGDLVLEEHGGLPPAAVGALARLAPGVGLCGVCALTRRGLYVDERGLAAHPQGGLLVELGVRTYAGEPLLASGQLVGTLAFASRTRTSFDAAELEFIRLVGHLVGAAKARARAADQLLESEARLRIFCDHAADAMFVHDARCHILDVNRQACASLGYSREELLGRSIADIDPQVTAADHETRMGHLDAGEPLTFDSVHRRKDGTTFPVEVRIRSFWAGPQRRSLSMARDISERQQAQDKLRLSEATLRRACAIAHLGSWTYTLARRTFAVSSQIAERTGWSTESQPEASVFDRIHPADRPRTQDAWQRCRAGAPIDLEIRFLVGAQTLWILVRAEPERGASGEVERITGVVQNVTAKRRLEDQLSQAQKLDAMGSLAGGIAHDFNNLLTVINSQAELLLGTNRLHAADLEQLEAIREAGARAAALTAQLLTFSRRQLLDVIVLDVDVETRRAVAMLRRVIPETIRLTSRSARELWRVRADSAQYQQIVVNLVLNARDAMPDGGDLTIETRNVTLDAADVADVPGGRPGPHVVLSVQDTGRGMTPEVRARVFEPFFTTKSPGQGTGLGMATVYGIVTQSGGHMRVQSEPGMGSRFDVLLPATTDAPSRETAALREASATGSEDVLVVEDDDLVRRVVCHALSQHGFRVSEASCGQDALAAARDAAKPFDLLVTDVVMPGIGGRTLASLLRTKQPSLRVLFMSGYLQDAGQRDEQPTSTDAFLRKPFTPSELVRKARSVLDAQ